MTFYLSTYQDNIDFALETKKTLFEEYGIDATIHIGNKIDGVKYKKNTVCYHNFLQLLKTVKDEDIYYIEDDIRFVSDPRRIDTVCDLNWCVYRFGSLTTKRQNITGTQCLYIKNNVVKMLIQQMSNDRPKHLDGYLSKFIVKNNLKCLQPKKIGYEKLHDSLISRQQDWIRFTKPPKI
jgi:hypothetical protein